PKLAPKGWFYPNVREVRSHADHSSTTGDADSRERRRFCDGIECAMRVSMRNGVREFEDLVCWQLSHQLECEIFDLTSTGLVSRDFKFRDQIRDSSASAPSNIAEGFGMFRPRDFARYLGTRRHHSRKPRII